MTMLGLIEVCMMANGFIIPEKSFLGKTEWASKAGLTRIGMAEEDEPETPAAASAGVDVTALKEEIASLEATLTALKKTASELEEDAEDYSEKGYLLKCAEMDNTRRRRDQANMDSRAAAKATVVREFLPVLDDLQALGDTFQGNSFAQGYSTLAWNLDQAFKDMDVEEIHAQPGDAFDTNTMNVVQERYSDRVPKGCVIQQLSKGFQIKGNLMRLVHVVISLGSEADALAAAAQPNANQDHHNHQSQENQPIQQDQPQQSSD